uniref:Septin 4 n=1 Tax=Capra hircus TaxID=9925 RepID=A0A8C2PDK7_CAPHI
GRAEPSTARHSTKGAGPQRREEASGSRTEGQSKGDVACLPSWRWWGNRSPQRSQPPSAHPPCASLLRPDPFRYCQLKPSSGQGAGRSQGCLRLYSPHGWGLSAVSSHPPSLGPSRACLARFPFAPGTQAQGVESRGSGQLLCAPGVNTSGRVGSGSRSSGLQRPEIKRFLEDADDAELNKFVTDFPGSETYHPPEAKTLVPRPQIQEPRPQASDLCQDDLEFKSPSWPQPSDSQQYFSASAPLSPSARPRSPWGKLDPYDSSEDDKEYVGFATLPNQVHRKSVKKGFDFTLMVAGESGLGKSTLVNSLFLTDLYRDRKLLSAEERIMQTVEITKHAVDIEEKGVKLRLTIVDTPGFGDAVNNTEWLRPLDVEFMKALHQRVNIVPILAKADTLTPPEVERKKRKIREEIEHFGIKVYQFPDCDSDEDEDFKSQDLALKESIPFAVIGSNTVVEARGRRVRGRLYPWGIVEVENPGHCDFVKLRTMLVRTHMQDLKDVTRETHYENYRAQCIQSMTRLVVKERNRNKLTLESGTDFPLPAVPPGTDPETERLIREKDEELRRMQEMLHKIQRQMKETH